MRIDYFNELRQRYPAPNGVELDIKEYLNIHSEPTVFAKDSGYLKSITLYLLKEYYQNRKGYKLLSTGNSNLKQAKLAKEFGYLVFNLSLAHASTSGFDVCPFSTKACEEFCVGENGNARFPTVPKARILKTRFFKLARPQFLDLLRDDINRANSEAERKSLTPVIRLDTFSDIMWERYLNLEDWPATQFYDYSKIYWRLGETPSNYHLTFSLSDSNRAEANLALARRFNVAVVFKTPDLPKTWNGRTVVNGDDHDFTFRHKPGRKFGKVIGLKAKGKTARDDSSGFVQATQ